MATATNCHPIRHARQIPIRLLSAMPCPPKSESVRECHLHHWLAFMPIDAERAAEDLLHTGRAEACIG
jgi:hypothetical protein